jgi:cytochrome c5
VRVRHLLIAVLVACGYPKPGPPPAPLPPAAIEAARLRFPGATAESLESGRQVFLRNCNRCHELPAIGAFSEAELERIVPRMARKAKLDEVQSQQVLQFVLAARSSSPITAAR